MQRLTNPGLRVLGVLPTLFDSRTNHARDVLADVSSRYGLDILTPAIAKSVRFAEAPSAGRWVLKTASRTPGATAYRERARRLLASGGPPPAAVPEPAVASGSGA